MDIEKLNNRLLEMSYMDLMITIDDNCIIVPQRTVPVIASNIRDIKNNMNINKLTSDVVNENSILYFTPMNIYMQNIIGYGGYPSEDKLELNVELIMDDEFFVPFNDFLLMIRFNDKYIGYFQTYNDRNETIN